VSAKLLDAIILARIVWWQSSYLLII